jgi:hypothetical protein
MLSLLQILERDFQPTIYQKHITCETLVTQMEAMKTTKGWQLLEKYWTVREWAKTMLTQKMKGRG